MADAREFREALARIRRNLNAGYLTPERLEADLAICDEAIAEIVDAVEPEFGVSRDGIHYLGSYRPHARDLRLVTVDGEHL